MTEAAKPQIAPLLLAQIIDAAPTRVRKRLDKEPHAANSWDWQSTEQGWSIQCAEETVTLAVVQGVVAGDDAIKCSCLLSPRCFHVLACVNTLRPTESQPDELNIDAAPAASADEETKLDPPPLLNVDAEMRAAAERVQAEIGLLLGVGSRRADLLRQSGLLRAGHSCRAAGLVNLGNLVLRVMESLRRQREAHDTADAEILAEGIALALEWSNSLIKHPQVALGIIGESRRHYADCDVRKLVGVCAEPVLTLSGYAGVVVHLQGVDSRPAHKQEMFSVSQVRPGDSQWVAQAYRGGIEMGNVTLEAAELCRHQLLVQNLTVSADGRLGKGTRTRWVLTPRPAEQLPFSLGRFSQPLDEQLTEVFQAAAITASEPMTGWDLIAFDAQVLGAHGATLVARVRGTSQLWKLRIAIDVPELPFRENFGLLGRCPGLVLRCLGRIRLQAAGEVDLLAITAANNDTWADDSGTGATERASAHRKARLVLPAEWHRICNLGCDRLERWHIEGVQRWSEEVLLAEGAESTRGQFEGSPLDGLEPLRRRQIGIALGGRHAVAPLASEAHRRDRQTLIQRHQYTAAELLDLLAQSAQVSKSGSGGPSRTIGTDTGHDRVPLETVYLANHLYMRRASLHTQQQLWEHKVSG